MNHVLHVIDSLALGGAERMLVELANAFASETRVSVCVTRSDTTLAGQLDPAIELLVLGRRRTTDVVPLIRLARWCRANRVDVLHAHGRSSFSLLALLAASRAVTAPIVFHDHRGLGPDATVPAWFRAARHFLGAYVGVYPGGLAWAARAGVPAARRHLIANAVDLAAVERQVLDGPPLPACDGPRLICIGGIRHEKAIDILLAAHAKLRAPAHLFVIGPDADPAYAAACKRQAGPRVAFLGPRRDALALAATADLAVHSSRVESGPLVLVEYAARGLPFVSTLVGGVAEELARLGAGRFVPADDPTALAEAIDRLLAEPAAERARLGTTWRALAWPAFDISAALPRWRAVYRDVA